MRCIFKRLYIILLMTVFTISMTSLYINVNAKIYENEVIKSEKDSTAKFWEEVNEKSKTSDMFEIESMREENVKHYRLSNGNYRAISYNKPVHVKDKEGKWQDIDNTLALDGSKYKTKDKRFSFNKYNTIDEYIMEYQEDDFSFN